MLHLRSYNNIPQCNEVLNLWWSRKEKCLNRRKVKTVIKLLYNCWKGELTSGSLIALWKASFSSYSESQNANTFAFKHTENRNQWCPITIGNCTCEGWQYNMKRMQIGENVWVAKIVHKNKNNYLIWFP
jgi:hypothetical protein